MKLAGQFWVPDEEMVQIHALENTGGWQLDHLWGALSLVKERRTAIDGGAHVGSWSKAMAKEFKEVHAFEPWPSHFCCLQKNLYTESNIITHNVALGDRVRYMNMLPDERFKDECNTGARYLSGPGEVKVVPLDMFDLEDVDFIKFDLEGFEAMALRGAAETIAKWHPIIQFEHKEHINARHNLPGNAAPDYLESLGMKKLARFGDDQVWGWP